MPSYSPPPQVGFNNNVRHGGRVFHIQTEDSGIRRPHIITHLFVDGGRIVDSARYDYSHWIGAEDLSDQVRRQMKTQHKAMFLALRDGALDERIAEMLGPPPLSAGGSGAQVSGSIAPDAGRLLASDLVPPSPRAGDEQAPPRISTSTEHTPLLEPHAAPSSASRRREGSEPARNRPSARAGVGGGLFRGKELGEQTLDAVILSYIADDLEQG